MNEKEKMQAIQNRDSSYDGKFIFGVKTTKIICRPGCPARVPLEKNIVFFDTIAEGFIRSELFSSLAVEGKLLSMSLWENEESVSKWCNLAIHRIAQKNGRMNDFADYKITVVTPVRTYTMTDRAETPADSNKYFGGIDL